MGKRMCLGAAHKLKKFRIKSLKKAIKNIETNRRLEAKSWRMPGTYYSGLRKPKPNICDKCGCTPQYPTENEPGIIHIKRDKWKKPKRGVDAYNAFTSKCVKACRLNGRLTDPLTGRLTGIKVVNEFLYLKSGDGLRKCIDEDVLIAAFEREGDALDVFGLDWTKTQGLKTINKHPLRYSNMY